MSSYLTIAVGRSKFMLFLSECKLSQLEFELGLLIPLGHLHPVNKCNIKIQKLKILTIPVQYFNH